MHSEVVKYEVNGLKMESVLYFDETKTGKRPAVIVFPEAFGLGDHAKEKAQKLAELGYVVLASDLFGEGKTVSSLEEVMAFIQPLQQQPEKVRAFTKAGYDAVTARPEVDAGKIAAIGYCFGGSASLELARSGANVRGVAGFHGGVSGSKPEDNKAIKAKVMVCIGADDPMIDANARAAWVADMTAAKLDWQMHIYGNVVHSFTNKEADARGMPDAIRYDANADRRSWKALVDFLEEAFA
jgi:dienelactone hydrolase